MTDTERHARFGKTDAGMVILALIWGVNFPVLKYATSEIPPVPFTTLRVIIAGLVMLTIAALRRRPWPPRRDALLLIALGVLGHGFYQLLFINGLARTKVGNAALIIAAAPAFIALVSRARGIERLKPRNLAGVALSIMGVALVVIGSTTTDRRDATVLGTALVFFGVLCWTAYTVLLQPLVRHTDPIQIAALTMIGGIIPLLFIGPPALASLDWGRVGAGAWSGLLYSSVISMGVAYLFWYRGLKILGPTRTSVYTNLQPPIAIIIAWIFLHDVPTVWQGLGTGTIMTGILLTRS
jgi:drug/metabolite transporter (DMT)-like permease